MLDEKTVAARIRGEQARTLENIAMAPPPQNCWWLSFADDDGFRGAVIVDANDFTEALMRASQLLAVFPAVRPPAVIRGLGPVDGSLIPAKWKNRILSREDCKTFDEEMQK